MKRHNDSLRLLLMIILGFIVASGFICHGKTAPRTGTKLTIVFTNDTLGIIEPCGCQKGMLGGLPRRATLFKKLRKEDPKLLLLDSGNILGPTSESLIAQLFAKVYRQLNYQAVALGTTDLRYHDTLTAEIKQAKTTIFTKQSASIMTVKGVKVGLLRIAQPIPKNVSREQMESLRRDLASLRRQTGLVIILSSLGRKQDEWLTKQNLSGDLLIGNQQWQSLKEPQRIGKTWIVPTSRRGEQVGRVDLTWERLGWQPSFQRYILDEKVADDAATARLLQNYYDEIARKFLSGKPYKMAQIGYGMASACRFCHRGVYRTWQKSKHAGALRLLKTKKRNRVPECLSCHSEYYRRTNSEPKDIAKQGVECASCHGDGIILILRPSQASKAARPNAEVCKKCHTPEKSPNFDFKKYKAKIKHW
jgi:hypothetical protein